MNKGPFIAVLLVVAAYTSAPLHAQPAISDLSMARNLWLNRDFLGAYQALKKYRDTDFGRSFEVDFMLGTSACRIPARRDRGAAFLKWVLYTYADQLSDEGLHVVSAQLTACEESGSSIDRPTLPNVSQVVTAGGHFQGKTFYWLGSNQAQASAHYNVRYVPLSEDVIRKRRVERGNQPASLEVSRLALPRGSVKAFSRFVITSGSNHTQAQITEANRLLEEYFNFFVEKYGMRAPKNYIFVYLVPSIERLGSFASHQHNLGLNAGTIAYSFRDDLSIAAVIPNTQFGSLFHELFHLLARSNFGDIPNWLDEGIAALYEVSRADMGEFRGLPNWRGEVLAKFQDRIPRLRELIEQGRQGPLDAQDVATGSTNLQREAIASATARYFALYLQDTNKLAPIYRAVRDNSTSDDFTGSVEEVVGLVERSAGEPIERLDVKFRTWLSSQDLRLRHPPRDSQLDKFIPPKPSEAR